MPRPRRWSTSRVLKVLQHRLFLFLPVATFAFFAPEPAEAQPQGLNATGYYITQIPPNQSDTEYQVCGSGVYPNINWTWVWAENHFGNCGWDQFMLHYTGYIIIPEGVTSVRFAVASDDGGMVNINGTSFGVWWDQGCMITYDERREWPVNQALPLDAWFYENGGGTCFMLFWQFDSDSADWNIVPPEAFSMEPPVTTTTTSTTVEETTTTQSTVVETSTTEPPVESTTTIPPTTLESTTTVPETTSTTTTTIVETTTTVPETTTTWLPTTTIAPTTTVLETTTTVDVSTTTTTTLPPTTESTPQTTQPSKNASEEVKKAFEEQVNVFDGKHDDYVPSGSTVTVAQRRAIVAATTVLFVLPIPVPTSSTSGSTSGRKKE